MSSLSVAERAFVEGIEPASLLDRTVRWAEINSGTANAAGLAQMADELAAACSSLPGRQSLVEPSLVERVGSNGAVAPVAHGRHLVVRVRPEAPRRVLLTGHMDTVYPADDSFQHCVVAGDMLHGPGTADMKGGLAIMLAGLTAFEESKPTLGYDVLVNSDEETGSLASAQLIAELARGKIAALTYEPALPDGGVARARPGSANLALVVRGRSAHAGRDPALGRNAVVAAADLALRLAALATPKLSVNPARIDGGGPNNRVPDLAILHVNLRPQAVGGEIDARAAVERLIGDVAARHEVAITLHGGFTRPVKPISDGTKALFGLVARASADDGTPLTWTDTGGVCDGNNIAAAGVPVIDTMGAIGGAIHSPDEWLSIPSLAARARLTALVLHRIDRGDLA